MARYLRNLESSSYEHDFDRKALQTLEKTPGLDFLIKKFWELALEKQVRLIHTGSGIKITPQSLPDVYDTYSEVCSILDIKEKPTLYVTRGITINAFATGVERHIIVLQQGAIEMLDREELMFILGHELGHVKSNHMLYKSMANIMNTGFSMVNPIANLLSKGIQLALMHWSRMAEYTCDRAGLLACQNPDKAFMALIKLSGLPAKYYSPQIIPEFIAQAKEMEEYIKESNLNKLNEFLLSYQSSHPWTVLRAAELMKWIDNGSYSTFVPRELKE